MKSARTWAVTSAAALAGGLLIATPAAHAAQPAAEKTCSHAVIDGQATGKKFAFDLCIENDGRTLKVEPTNFRCTFGIWSGETDCGTVKFDAAYHLTRDGKPIPATREPFNNPSPYPGPGVYEVSTYPHVHAEKHEGLTTTKIDGYGTEATVKATFTNPVDAAYVKPTISGPTYTEDYKRQYTLTVTNGHPQNRRAGIDAWATREQPGFPSMDSITTDDKRCRAFAGHLECDFGKLDPGQSVSITVTSNNRSCPAFTWKATAGTDYSQYGFPQWNERTPGPAPACHR